jgi:peptide/nickel transport system permease protein
LRHRRGALVAIAVLLALFVAAFMVPLVWRVDPNQVSVDILDGPSWSHLLGTDAIGRDLLARALTGARFSFEVSAAAVLVSAAGGTIVGLVSGYFGGVTDAILMRITDGILAFPGLLLALGVVGILGPGVQNAMLGLAIAFMPSFARLIRGQALAVRQEPYVEAAIVAGAGPGRIVRRHIIPNLLGPLVVQTLLTLGLALLAEGALSFVGLSVQPPAASLGSLLQEGFTAIDQTPRLILVPGLIITIATWSCNALADGLRDAFASPGRDA